MLKIFTNFGGIPSVCVVALDAATVTDIAFMHFAAVAVCVVARGHVAGDDDAMSAFNASAIADCIVAMGTISVDNVAVGVKKAQIKK